MGDPGAASTRSRPRLSPPRPTGPAGSNQVRADDILVGGLNDGMGSSHPAARSLRNLGIAALLAASINGLFFRNAVNFGHLALECRGAMRHFRKGKRRGVARGFHGPQPRHRCAANGAADPIDVARCDDAGRPLSAPGKTRGHRAEARGRLGNGVERVMISRKLSGETESEHRDGRAGNFQRLLFLR
jgi:Aconitase C-terminal domain